MSTTNSSISRGYKWTCHKTSTCNGENNDGGDLFTIQLSAGNSKICTTSRCRQIATDKLMSQIKTIFQSLTIPATLTNGTTTSISLTMCSATTITRAQLKSAPSCSDGNKNQDETSIDCGGTVCAARCGLSQACTANSDCAYGNCHQTLKMCQASSCSDGNQNQDETGIDCGGTVCAARCGLNQTCAKNADCTNGNCHQTKQTCQEPSCTDGNKNQDEVNIDCGGATCSNRCGINQACLVNSDLPSCCDGNTNQDESAPDCGGQICYRRCSINTTCSINSDCITGNCHKWWKTCQVPSCSDGNKNLDETGIDCGGSTCEMRCGIGSSCSQNSDCANSNCHYTQKTCQAPSCPDGNKNDGESDVDCGGSSCNILCNIGQTCNINSDCQNGNCHQLLKICAVPSCSDGNTNQDESAIDCGGNICTARCGLNQPCLINSDCTNGNCHNTLKTCQEPSCDDGNINQQETDVDCGGSPCTAKCGIGSVCSQNSDCANGNCHHTSMTCQNPSCDDGNINELEGDIDCGGPCITKCSIHSTCLVNADCANGNCHHTSKTCELPSCDDGNTNQQETDVDCGGSPCTARCGIGSACSQNSDCANGNCHHTSMTCQPYSCDDGNTNEGETDIDCGGPCSTKCPLGEACSVNSDCANGNCHHTSKTCQNPSCDDGNINQGESSIDCGGPVCGATCALGNTCSGNQDCANGNCHHTKLTCELPSCDDGNKNEQEGDIDCGGPCAVKCGLHSTCLLNTDCANGNCHHTSFTCERKSTLFLRSHFGVPSCDDGNTNQQETDVDCGGSPCTARCNIGEACQSNSDCTNGNCHATAKICDSPECSDGNKNNQETDVDCGGTCAVKCDLTKGCLVNADCSNGNCHHTLNTCQPPSCDDGNKNQGETDIDCGGPCGTTCILSETCSVNGDCVNGNCHKTRKQCLDPSCDDGNKNQGESDVDCGGPCSTQCPLGQACSTNSDCANGNCHTTLKICAVPSCSDGNKNQQETDVDCGGNCPTLCPVNSACLKNTDCVNGNCHTTLKQCLPESCDDGNKNQQETDVDCGGSPCPTRCAVTKTCVANTDCINNNCHTTLHTCQNPSCNDGNLNQFETDVDCGGTSCGSTCGIGKQCLVNSDCANGNCDHTLKTCQPPSCNDGNKNQNEGDIDCGTPCTTKCSLGSTCLVNADCANGNCDTTQKKCVDPSCFDGNKNQAETDIDCAGPCVLKCGLGQSCSQNSDCSNTNCHATLHTCQNPSCNDGNLNQFETDVDCGGTSCGSTCAIGKQCLVNTDCANGNCDHTSKTCQAPSCTDGNKNQNEGDIDCGTPCTTKCSVGSTCLVNADCANGNCDHTSKTCQAPSCTDGNQNEGEIDIDCSGPCATKCSLNQICAANSDCANGNCDTTLKKCVVPSCNDGNKNQNEGDIDCGGSCTAKCALSQSCSVNTDCANGNCHTTAKTCQNPSCTDGNQNEGETDIDCGGTYCPATCQLTKKCLTNADCANGNCHTTLKTCQNPSCSDGNQNEGETDIDCGGTYCPATCQLTKKCLLNGDCANGNCHTTLHTCQASSCSDGNKNQDETDIDCGGTCGATCALNKVCAKNGDCTNGNCHTTQKKCLAPSCDDGYKNQNEPDVDCGGVCGATCVIPQACLINGDCANSNCDTTTKKCATPSCSDGNKNQQETDVDCGGGSCTKCNNNKGCASYTDCSSANCVLATHLCQAATCFDGYKNQGESDIDCGGSCSGCALNQACTQNSDCANGNCHKSLNTCQPPSCGDGNLNNGEIDTDCGHTACSNTCAKDKKCQSNLDCGTNLFCS
ncbi:unnamed protein product, partial [Adineta steineri]